MRHDILLLKESCNCLRKLRTAARRTTESRNLASRELRPLCRAPRLPAQILNRANSFSITNGGLCFLNSSEDVRSDRARLSKQLAQEVETATMSSMVKILISEAMRTFISYAFSFSSLPLINSQTYETGLQHYTAEDAFRLNPS